MSRLGLQGDSWGPGNNKGGYTLVELAITVSVILILSSIAIYAYFGALAHARETVCETNLKSLKNAVEEYVLENDVMPATLGHLKIEHLEKGYAKSMNDMGWLTKLSLLLLEFDESGSAYAQFLSNENLKAYNTTHKMFNCPADGNGQPSYGINANLEGRRWSDVEPHEIIIADSDQYVFTSPEQLAKRHNHQALAISRSGQIVQLPVVDDNDPSPDESVHNDKDKDKVTICHKGKNTITISRSALDAHLAKGSTLGPCPE